MDAQTALNKIEELVKIYNETANRQALTNLRQMVTKLLRQNYLLRLRIEEIFNRHQLSMSIL
jgi:hypothetical protein